jgi:hypothetical protein
MILPIWAQLTATSRKVQRRKSLGETGENIGQDHLSRDATGTQYLSECKMDSNPFEPQLSTFVISITGFVFTTFKFSFISLVLFEVMMYSQQTTYSYRPNCKGRTQWNKVTKAIQ